VDETRTTQTVIEDELVITTKDGEGNELKYIVLTTFEIERGEYIALLPYESDEKEEINIQLFRYQEVDGGIEIIPIYSDMEFEVVLKKFTSLVKENKVEEE